jgi:tRNA threonylcarbamoyladenosine biosynthesis protein TsaB
MTLVAFDTSMAVTAACVLRPGGEPARTPAPDPARLLGPPAHSAELLPALAGLLDQAGTGWDEVEAIAVGVGPGTFTGLRIGVATARALAQGLDVPLHPVSSLEALAAGLASHAAPGTALLPLIDAKRGQVFASLFRAAERPEREWGPLALAPEELENRIGELGEVPLAAGDWALESRSRLEAAGAVVPAPDSGLHAVDALHVCRLARGTEPQPPERVEPLYVRQPDAEIARSARLETGPDGAA